MLVWSGFLLGFLGSFHCVGMCGPIAIALPGSADNRRAFIFSRLIYNFGRVITYSMFGLGFGLIGHTVALAGYQQSLSILIGVAVLLMVLLPVKLSSKVLAIPVVYRAMARLKAALGARLHDRSKRSLLLLGILNGFLPCGFVYLAIAGAINTGNIAASTTYMALFGLGTVPIMVVTSLLGNLFGVKFRRMIYRLVPVGAIVLATLFILRGMALGIPYLSPKLPATAATTTQGSSCH